MDYKKINMYNRLRDHFVPSSVLDDIFRSETDIKTLENAYDSLVKDGFSEDDAAEEIADLVFKETGINPNYGFDEEE
tara:strand:- start:1786 stop:2016 length:231 start_codon:yes stop_codon:yes gene_type:complete